MKYLSNRNKKNIENEYKIMNKHTQVLEPKNILSSAGVGGNKSVADFGCGPGIFTIPAAELTSGVVYAFDVQQSALEAVTNQIHIHNIPNIIIKRVNLELIGGSQLDDCSVSFVIIRKILLQNKKKDIILREAYRVLREDGILIIMGWTSKALIGPQIGDRIEQGKLISLVTDEKFVIAKRLLEDESHYVFTFSK